MLFYPKRQAELAEYQSTVRDKKKQKKILNDNKLNDHKSAVKKG